MRLLYVNDALAIWGGLERLLADQMNMLVEMYGYEVHLATVNQGDHPLPYPLHPSITHTDLGIGLHHKYRYKGLKRLWKMAELEYKYIHRLRKLVSKVKPDIIVLMRFEHWEVYFCTHGIPLVVESHSMCRGNLFGPSTWQQLSWVTMSKYLAKRARVVVTLTEGDASDWRCYTPHVCVIPNVVHLNESGKYSHVTAKSVIFTGRIAPQKDVFVLLQIWKKVHERHPEWVLDVYGEGEQEVEFRQEVETMDANICLHAPTTTIMDRFRESSMLVLTSIFEPFGLVMPEAMSCGLPVVSFDCPYGPEDIITDGVDGFLVRNRSISDFADRICQLIEDEPLRIRMGKAAVQSAQRYAADKIMPLWNNLFTRIGSQK